MQTKGGKSVKRKKEILLYTLLPSLHETST